MTFFFLSAISLKRLNAVLSAAPSTSKPSSSSALRSAWRPECLPSTIEFVSSPIVVGVHDLVGRALLEHAVLVDAGLVREGVAPHDRLVRLHRVAGQARHEPARARDLARVDAGPQVRRVDSRVCSSITISSSEALPARSPIPLTAHSTWRQPAVQRRRTSWRRRGPRSLWQCTETTHVAQARHEPVELLEHRRVLVRHRVADGVGHVDRGRALVERDLDHLGHELHVRARAVLGRELHVVGVLARVRHGGARLALHVLARRLELALDVDVAGRDEGVDARALGVLDRVPGGVDVLGARCARARRSPGPRPRGRSPAPPRSRPAR